MYPTDFIERINSLKKELETKIPLGIEDEKRLKRKLRLEFNYNSNHLEGNTLTYGQTELLLLYDKSSGDVKLSDIEEMKAHDVALSQIEEMARESERPLTESFICELNKLILVRPFWKEAIDFNGNSTRKKIEIGKYKSTPNSVRLRNGEIHEYASVEATPAMMTDLIDWYRENEPSMHPVQLAALFHYRFVCIHPFDDGNGRVSRLIMNYILLKNNYPPIIIKSADKENYLTALQKADTGNQLAIIEYVEQQAIWSLELSLKAANGEDLEEKGDIDKEIELLKREKLSKTKIIKSSEVCLEVIKHINNDLWAPITKELNKFNDFFIDVIDQCYINSAEGQVFTSKELPHDISKLDLESEVMTNSHWFKEMKTLKFSSEKVDYKFDGLVDFNHSEYEFKLTFFNYNSSLGNESIEILKFAKEYGIFSSLEEIDEMIKTISKHIIKQIKEEE